MNTLLTSILLAVACTGQAAHPPKDDAKGKIQWTPLFNGKDLAGWNDVLDNGSEWRVTPAGQLEGRGCGRGKPAVLVSERNDYRNFRLKVTFGFHSDTFGGAVEIRRTGESDATSGYFISCVGSTNWSAKDRPPGNLTRLKRFVYGSTLPPAHESAPIAAGAKRWHTLEVVATGNRITTFVNGHKADEYVDAKNANASGGIAIFCQGDSVMQIEEIAISELAE